MKNINVIFRCLVITVVSLFFNLSGNAGFFVLLAPSPVAAQQNYTIGSEDELSITVWDHPDLTRKIRVNTEGKISFPLIGEISAANRTPIQLENDLKSRLEDGYIVNPQISVEVSGYRSQKISIIGEVNTPGSYPLTKKTLLIEAIAMAGGVKQDADHEIMIVRPRAGNRNNKPLMPNQADPNDVIKVPIRDVLEGEKTNDFVVMNGDTIFVPKIKVFYVTGEVKQPGQFTFMKGMTVLQAISTAGGFTEKSARRKLRVVRKKAGKEEDMTVSPDSPLEPGDTIVVPESFW